MATASSNIASYNSDHSYYSISNASQGYASSTSSNYATVNLTRGSRASSYIYWEFSLPTIPTGATINSISCNYRAGVSSTTTRYIASAYIQMCSGTTTMGTAKSIMATSPNATSFSSTEIGTWTVAQINAGVKLKQTATRGTSSTNSNYAMRFYGADISITYTEASGNKVYIKVSGTWKEASEVLVKRNGSWVSVSDVYKKVSGSWVKQSDKSALFDQNGYYVSAPSSYEDTNLVMNLDGITSYANRYNSEYMYIGITDVGMKVNDIVCDGQSFEFNGISSYMIPSASSTMDAFLYNTHTLEIYFEPYSWGTETGNRTSLYIGRASNSIGLFGFINSSNNPAFIRSCTTGTKMLEMSALPAVNTKHYLAFNNNGWLLDGTYYADASLTSSTNYIAVNNQNIVDNTYKCVSIGRRFKDNTNPQYFHGKIYAIRIHSTLLTEAQMRNNMNYDAVRFG